MRKRAWVYSACVSAAVLALAACSGGDGQTASPSSVVTETVQVTEPAPSPTPTLVPSFPAGIPTDEPTDEPGGSASFTAHITLATADPDSGGLLVGGFVSGVSQDGGACQFVITPSSGAGITVDSVGVENGSTTSCGSQVVPRASVPPGEYSVVLKYSNGGVTATSESVKVTMP